MDCKKVLIVEDDDAIRQMMQDVLELEGYTTYTACDGKEGIEMLKKDAERPCLILLDMMMPRYNGWQFLDIQRDDPSLSQIPVVICSAYKESARSVRPAGFIEKPVQLKSLINTVKAFCA